MKFNSFTYRFIKSNKGSLSFQKKLKDKLQNNREQVEETINKYRANVL